jgi:hypothetical protein
MVSSINLRKRLPANAAVERPRVDVSGVSRVHNEMTHMWRTRDAA